MSRRVSEDDSDNLPHGSVFKRRLENPREQKDACAKHGVSHWVRGGLLTGDGYCLFCRQDAEKPRQRRKVRRYPERLPK